ncbi:MAG TPA: PRC-barrel domain-containing protein [Galbitalea sp.]|jgi:sporulation protein YlmC with PRC-barrel domain
MNRKNSPLVRLRDMGETIADPKADVRGRTVLDNHGEDVGKVDALIIDRAERKVRFLQVAFGGFLGLGKKNTFIPVEAITGMSPTTVSISSSHAHVSGAPTYDPVFIDDISLFEQTFSYYGVAPFWGTLPLPPAPAPESDD